MDDGAEPIGVDDAGVDDGTVPTDVYDAGVDGEDTVPTGDEPDNTGVDGGVDNGAGLAPNGVVFGDDNAGVDSSSVRLRNNR